MIRVAQDRISELFSLAEQEARRGAGPLPERYVGLARRIGMRYNVRLLVEYHDLFCRGCGAYWVEGRTVRTRLRRGRRTQTCLRCGRARRRLLKPKREDRGVAETGPVDTLDQPGTALVEEEVGVWDVDLDEGEEE
jgi:RNase P subunit RPR2